MPRATEKISKWKHRYVKLLLVAKGCWCFSDSPVVLFLRRLATHEDAGQTACTLARR